MVMLTIFWLQLEGFGLEAPVTFEGHLPESILVRGDQHSSLMHLWTDLRP